jgi:hypothetical protein
MDEIAFVAQLRAAIMRRRIYPPGNHAVEEALTNLAKAISVALAEKDTFTLTCSAGKIRMGTKEIPQAGILVGVFQEHQIHSLTFGRGCREEEVRELVSCVSQKRRGDMSFGDWLRLQKVAHVVANQTKILEVSGEETVVDKGMARFQNLRSPEELQETLNTALTYIDRFPEASQRTQLRRHLADRLAVMEAPLLRRFLDMPEPSTIELVESVLAALRPEKLAEIFNEICRWDQKIAGLTTGKKEFEEERGRMKAVLERLFQATALKEVARPLFEELLRRGLIPAVPEGLRGSSERDWGREAERLLEAEDGVFLEGSGGEDLSAFCGKLLERGEKEWVRRLTERLRVPLLEGDTGVRKHAVTAMRALLPLLWGQGMEESASLLRNDLMQALSMERQSVPYRESVLALGESAVHDYRAGDASSSLAVMTALRAARLVTAPAIEDQSSVCADALSRVVVGLFDALVEDLNGDDPVAADTARRMVECAGDRAAPVFVGVIRSSRDRRRRWVAAEGLKALGSGAVKSLAAELNLGLSTRELYNVISVLGEFMSEELVDPLRVLAQYPDADLRREVVRFLIRVPGEKAGALLSRFLSEEDKSVRRPAIVGLGERRWADAVPELLRLLELKTTEPQEEEEICIALGKIGDERAVEPLGRLINLKGNFLRFGSGVAETVRLRAAWALARIGTFAAKEKLRPFLNDPNAPLQQLARETLS